MRNYHLHLSDLPRTLEAPLPLSALVSYDNAMGTWNGRRGNVMEFAIRIASSDACSVDIQDGVESRMPFPHVYLKYPGTDFHTPPFAPREAFALLYDGSLCGVLREAGFPLDPGAWPLKITEEMRELMRKMDALCEKMSLPGYIDRIDGYALCLLREVMLQRPRGEAVRDGAEAFYAERIQGVASFLRCHYAERIDLNEVIRTHGLSRRTFFRYWKRMFPMPPRQFLLDLRMREARRLLLGGTAVSEVAFHLNYPDCSCFSEQFRQRCGESPDAWRKRQFSAEISPLPPS